MGRLFGTLAILAVSLINLPPASADIVFNYAKGSPVSLGRSIDARLPSVTKKDCLVDTTSTWVESEPAQAASPGGVVSVSVSGEYIDNYRELFDRLHLNASFKGNAAITDALKVGGELNIDYGKEFEGKYSDLSYVLMARYEFGSRRLARPQLQTTYEDYLKKGEYKRFIEECGTHFVVSEERWANAAVIVGIQKLDESIRRKLKADYKSKVEVVEIGSGEMGLDAEKELRQNRKYGVARLTFNAAGGDPTKAAKLASATQAGDLKLALQAMEEYMTGIARDTSSVKSYRLASFEVFGLKLESDVDVTSFLEAIYYAGLLHQRTLDYIKERVEDAKRFPALTQALLQIYERDIYAITQKKAAIDSLAVGCVRDKICNVADILRIAPNLNYSGSLLRSPILQGDCLYSENILTEIAVRLSGRFLDPSSVQDFRIYRLPEYENGKPSQTDIKRTGLSEDPGLNRFVASVDYLRDDSSSRLSLPQEARATRYQMAVSIYDGSTQWYDLGYLNISADRCPLRR